MFTIVYIVLLFFLGGGGGHHSTSTELAVSVDINIRDVCCELSYQYINSCDMHG